MRYFLKPSALKDFKRLSKPVQKIIVSKLDFYIETDNPLAFSEPLKDKSLGGYRFRIGDYRVIFDVAADALIVLAIGHRREIYK